MSGGIFISYRRQDTSDLAGRLYDRLADHFGEARVFMDVDTIELGVDFAEVIARAVGTCEVLLAVIGPHWLTATGQDGRRRLDDPDDIVRLEIEAALARDVRVIPILVAGAVMPRHQELPESLGRLARRNGLGMRHESFRSDVARLVAAIEGILAVNLPSTEPSVVPLGPEGSEPKSGEQMNPVMPPLDTTLYPLPPDIRQFTGRDDVLTVLSEDLRVDQRQVTVLVVGLAGVGKTALATHLAHEMSRNFPDGCLFVNLRGVERQRLEAAEVLAGFLRALGVDGSALPAGEEELAGLYRSRLAGRRVLVVLDNADADEASVRPLLALPPGCAAIVTSRHTLAGLDVTTRVQLDALDPDKALELFANVVGVERTAADPAAAERIVRLAGYLPLAVCIAGGKLNAKPHWTTRTLAERMEARLLDELRQGDKMVRASFALSYEDRSPEERRAFRLLGLVQAPSFCAWAAADLFDADLATAEDLVERLVDAWLLVGVGEDPAGRLRYRFHDLLRLYARERLQAEEPPEDQERAVERLLGGYLTLTELADARLKPDGRRTTAAGRAQRRPALDRTLVASIERDPMLWLTTETVNLVSAVRQAHDAGLHELAWELAAAVADFLDIRALWPELREVNELGLESSRLAGSRYGEGVLLHWTGLLARYQGRLDDAQASLEASLEVFVGVADPVYEAYTVREIAIVQLEQGHWQEAIERFERCLQQFRQLGDRRFEAYTLQCIGTVHHRQGQVEQATAFYRQSLELYEQIGDVSGQAATLRLLGDAQRLEQRLAEAIGSYRRSLQLQLRSQDRVMEAWTRASLGQALAASGEPEAARAAWLQALPVFEELHLAEADEVRASLEALSAPPVASAPASP